MEPQGSLGNSQTCRDNLRMETKRPTGGLLRVVGLKAPVEQLVEGEAAIWAG